MEANRVEFRSFVSQFPFLNTDEVDTIVEHTVLQEFPEGSVLLKEGQIASQCFAVIRGCVREFYLKDGEEKTTAFFTEGQSVNSFSSYSNQVPSKHYLVCAEDCLLTVGNQSLVDAMCDRLPRLSQFLQVEVEKEFGALQERMANFMTSSPEERYNQLMDYNPSLFNRVPQHQIASYLGVTPESLSRIKRRATHKS
jgi:CRP-like cAMP-binding protein